MAEKKEKEFSYGSAFLPEGEKKYSVIRWGWNGLNKEDQIDTSALAAQAPNLPTLLNTALEQFVKDYEDYDRGLRQAFEAMGTLYTAPPVLIVVCNNTTVSHEVYRDIAGYQDGVNEDGEPRYRKGRFCNRT